MGARRAAILAAATAAILGTGCLMTDDGGGSFEESAEREVRTRIESFATLRGEAYEENVRTLGRSLRGHSVPHLLEALDRDADPRVRAGCALALADAQDPRAVGPLHEAAGGDADPGVRFTAAYSLCRYRDARGLPVLFGALRSEDPQTRFIAIYRLKEVTGQDLGFVPTDPPSERTEALARWEAWFRDAGPTGAGARLLPVE